ncbi:MAG: glycosyltransferase [Terracidiphilus sp.]
MNLPSKLLLVIPHLGGGGAERVMALLACGLSAQKYELHLALLTQAEPPAEVALPPWVHIHALGARRVRGAALRLLRLTRRIQPDLILSGIFHANFLVLALGPCLPTGTRVLVRQNGTVSSALEFGGLPWYTRSLYRLLYRRADRVICQTQAMAADLARELGVPMERIAVLPNPLDVESIRASIAGNLPDQSTVCQPLVKVENSENLPSVAKAHPLSSASCGTTKVEPFQNTTFTKGPCAAPQLLAVGRLSAEKGFDLLLGALALLRAEIPDARLVIAGSGPEEAALKAETHALGLDAAVDFAGHLADPWRHFPDATLFVLPSRQEGLPNALLEAAAAGLPIVATPASAGLVELLRGQAGVWLAPEISAEALAASMRAALRALPPGERFAHPFVEAFRLDRAIPAFERLIDQTIAAKP